MELLERSLREERVVLREWRRKRKIIIWFLYADGLARPCQASGHGLQFFFLFSNHVWTIIPAKQIKITQNKQNKSNKTCGLPPTKRSFNDISLTVKRFIYPIPNLSLMDNGIKLTISPKSHMAFSIVSYPMTHGMENSLDP